MAAGKIPGFCEGDDLDSQIPPKPTMIKPRIAQSISRSSGR